MRTILPRDHVVAVLLEVARALVLGLHLPTAGPIPRRPR
jgi:hypothetical protein